MRKIQKQEILEFIKSLDEANEEIKSMLENNRITEAQSLLAQCQEFAIQLGETIERLTDAECPVIAEIETYCECLYHAYGQVGIDIPVNKIYKTLKKQLLKVENGVKNDISVRKEIAFFPYKASMWDSLESVYLAAKADEDCDAYCVPIPYYDINSEREFGQMHYEGKEFPPDIEVIDWETYQFEERRPDVIFIHNPYDDYNLVTTVHPRFYSSNLKKYTETLVYVPYFSTAGKMGEAFNLCPAYIHADYIVIQNKEHRQFYHEAIPDKKFLALGSPKFDRVLRMCNNPQQMPKEWHEIAAGRKIYFYNTSITGMLRDTEQFLKKMQYVFECFENNKNACILWRPHPLLESTFASLRPEYRSVYEKMKDYFFTTQLGIYDTTPDITNSIAFSDAYIGDAGTSVTSLFGIAGKPIFILNNQIHEAPKKDDWRAQIIPGMTYSPYNKWMIIQRNALYQKSETGYDYHFYCELPGKGNRWVYSVWPYEIKNKLYIYPTNSQEITIVDQNKKVTQVPIDKYEVEKNAFRGGREFGKYLIVFPNTYPEVVRFNTETMELNYFAEPIEVNVVTDEEGTKLGGLCKIEDNLYFASPIDNRIMRMHVPTGEFELIELPIQNRCGCVNIVPYGKEMWLIPYSGNVITVWNTETNAVQEYPIEIQGLSGCNPNTKEETEQCLFMNLVLSGGYVYLTPNWGNMYAKLNLETGKAEQWIPPYKVKETNSYFRKVNNAAFIIPITAKPSDTKYQLFSYADRSMYEIDLENDTSKEVPITFDEAEIIAREQGFALQPSIPYACVEGLFNSLPMFLEKKTAGVPYNGQQQIQAFRVLAENLDGTCGEKIYRYMKKI